MSIKRTSKNKIKKTKKQNTAKSTNTKKGQRHKYFKNKRNNITKKNQKGGNPDIRIITQTSRDIKRLQEDIKKKILYDDYDWTKTLQSKKIGDKTYNNMLGLDNEELLTQKYADLLSFVDASILHFKSDTNKENVKMYLVKEDELSPEDKAELEEQEEAYKAKYKLKDEEPIDLVEGMIKQPKDTAIYFENLNDQFATIRDFLEFRRKNLEDCKTKEPENTKYFEHEINSCSALLAKYDSIQDKKEKEALTKFVGEISDTLYYNKVFYELNKNIDNLNLEGIDEIEVQLLKTFIPLQFFDEQNKLKLEELKVFLSNPKNKYFYQQFIYGIMSIRDKYYKFPYNSLNNKTEANNHIQWFAPHNEMYKPDNNCGDFVYWSLRFNNYFMYLSTFSDNKLFPSRYVLPLDYKYPNYEQLKSKISETTLSDDIKTIIRDKETFAFAISDYQGQLFNPQDINKLQFIGCLMIKFQKIINGKTVNRIWILFYFKNNNSDNSYESNVTGKKFKFVSCNINFFITDNTNITYRQLVSYKELKQYYYYSINPDKNTNTTLSFYRYDTTKLQDKPGLAEKYKHVLLITRHNDDNAELQKIISECNLVKVELKLLGEKYKSFNKEKYKYGITGDIFYLE